MKQKFTQQQKQEMVIQYLKGYNAKEIYSKNGISKSTFYDWVSKYSNEVKESNEYKFHTENKKTISAINKKDDVIEILQTVKCNANSSLQDKLAEMELIQDEYSVHALCEALNVSRGTFYNHIKRNKKDNKEVFKRREELKPIIKDIFETYNQIFGAKRIKVVLEKNGYIVSVRLITEIMKEIGLKPVSIKAKPEYYKTLKREKGENLLNNNFNVSAPNEVWVCDFTSIRIKDEIFYICVIIDLYSRKVISYKVTYSQTTQVLTSTFKNAVKTRNPNCNKLTFHSDRGCQYTSKSFRKLLKNLSVTQSFSERANPYNNSVAESFFSHAKTEEFYRIAYRSKAEFLRRTDEYIKFFNDIRPHRFNNNKSPNDREKMYYEALEYRK